MRAIVIDGFGGPERMCLKEVPPPVPEDNQILIRASFAGVNPVDWKIREGYLNDILPHRFPLILGWDVAGKVESLGKNVNRFQKGDRVFAFCRKPEVQWGSYAEFVTVDAESVAPVPTQLTDAQAAAIPLTALTAWQALFEFAAPPAGSTILVHAGAGGVGGFAIQFAKWAGHRVLTTASSGKHAYVHSLGADEAIDYASTDFVAEVLRLAPNGVDVVVDCVGGETARRSFVALRRGGSLVSIVDTPDEALAGRHGVKAGFVFVRPDGEALRKIASLFDEGSLRVPKIETLRLEDAPLAHTKSESHRTVGKIVLSI